VALGGDDDVAGIAGSAFELAVAAAEVTFGLQVSDDGLDGGAAAQLGLGYAEDACSWPEMKMRRRFACPGRDIGDGASQSTSMIDLIAKNTASAVPPLHHIQQQQTPPAN